MLFSKVFIPILKNDPTEAKIMNNYVRSRRNSENPTSFKTVQAAINAVAFDITLL